MFSSSARSPRRRPQREFGVAHVISITCSAHRACSRCRPRRSHVDRFAALARLSARSRVSITAPSSAMVEFSDALVTVVSPKILGNDVNRSAPPSGYARSSKQFTMEEAGARLTSGMPPLLKQFELSQADGLCFGDKRAFAPGRQTLRDQDWGGAGGVGGGVEAQQGLQNGQAPHGAHPVAGQPSMHWVDMSHGSIAPPILSAVLPYVLIFDAPTGKEFR